MRQVSSKIWRHFLTRIHEHLEAAQIDRLGVELLAGIGDFELVLADGQEQFLAVQTRRHVDEMRLEELFLAFLEIVAIQIRIGVPLGTRRFRDRTGLRSRQVVQIAVRADGDALIVAFGDRDGHEMLR